VTEASHMTSRKRKANNIYTTKKMENTNASVAFICIFVHHSW